MSSTNSIRRLFAYLAVPVYLSLMSALAAPAQAAWPGRDGPVVYAGFDREGEGLLNVGLRTFSFPFAEDAPHQLTSDATDRDPQVSPDGELIAFSRELDPNASWWMPSSIVLMDMDGGQPRALTSPPAGEADTEPTFSASGKRVIFVREGDLYSIGISGGRA